MSKIGVNGAELKKVFKELVLCLNKSLYEKTINVTLSNDGFTIEVCSLVHYIATLDIEGEVRNKVSSLVTFKDISDLILPETILVEIQDEGLYLYSNSGSIVLYSSESEHIQFPMFTRVSELKSLTNQTLIASGISKLLNASTLSNIYKTGMSITFDKNIMQVSYPVLMIQADSCDLYGTVDVNVATLVKDILLSGFTFDYVNLDDSIVLVSGNKRYLKIQITKNDLKSITKYASDRNYIAETDISDMKYAFRSMYKFLQKMDVVLQVYRNGCGYTASSEEIKLVRAFGDTDEFLFSFVTKAEFINIDRKSVV